MDYLEILTTAVPVAVTFLYAITGLAYLIRGDLAWAMVWLSYSSANFGLIVIGLRKRIKKIKNEKQIDEKEEYRVTSKTRN